MDLSGNDEMQTKNDNQSESEEKPSGDIVVELVGTHIGATSTEEDNLRDDDAHSELESVTVLEQLHPSTTMIAENVREYVRRFESASAMELETGQCSEDKSKDAKSYGKGSEDEENIVIHETDDDMMDVTQLDPSELAAENDPESNELVKRFQRIMEMFESFTKNLQSFDMQPETDTSEKCSQSTGNANETTESNLESEPSSKQLPDVPSSVSQTLDKGENESDNMAIKQQIRAELWNVIKSYEPGKPTESSSSQGTEKDCKISSAEQEQACIDGSTGLKTSLEACVELYPELQNATEDERVIGTRTQLKVTLVQAEVNNKDPRLGTNGLSAEIQPSLTVKFHPQMPVETKAESTNSNADAAATSAKDGTTKPKSDDVDTNQLNSHLLSTGDATKLSNDNMDSHGTLIEPIFEPMAAPIKINDRNLIANMELIPPCERTYHTIHIDTTSSPSSSVMRRPPLCRRCWNVISHLFTTICVCLQINKDCIFCIGFFIAFVVSASFLTAFFYRTLSVSPKYLHTHFTQIESNQFQSIEKPLPPLPSSIHELPPENALVFFRN